MKFLKEPFNEKRNRAHVTARELVKESFLSFPSPFHFESEWGTRQYLATNPLEFEIVAAIKKFSLLL
jgi:hypothetical protein